MHLFRILFVFIFGFGFLCPLFTSPAKKEKVRTEETASPATSSASGKTGLLLQTVGTLAAQGLYLTYTSIGALTDGFSAQAYDKETTQSLMLGYINLSKVCRDQLGILVSEGKLSPEDKKTLREIEVTYGFLINQGQAFLDYIESGDQAYLGTFDENRKLAWTRIAKILQIPE